MVLAQDGQNTAKRSDAGLELECERGRETSRFPVAELFEPRGLKAQRSEQ